MNMTHGSNGGRPEDKAPPRPPSTQSSQSSSGSGSSKHVKCIGRYVLTPHTLGKGNFARVVAAVHTLTRARVAVKIIETDKIQEEYVRKNLLREAQLMRRLHHPNIIRLYETMKSNTLYCLVMEVAEGEELLSHVKNDFKEKRMSEAAARPFIRQLVSALYYLHCSGIVHRDLKMENILLDKKKRNVKLVDFGLSNAQKPGSLLQTHCGSPEYAAPELFIPGREYGPEVDVWSLGVNMYAMLVGKLPFRSPRHGTRRRQRLLEQITAGLSESHEKEMLHLSPGAKDLLCKLLQPDPHKRITLDVAMQHLWITKDGTHPLHPHKHTPPDAATQVMQLMSQVLEVSQAEIKETVRRDRCDWLAAIYNLLIDQPEGRNILQSMITGDPADQLVDAAHYQGSIEHLRLSQADTLDQTPPDVASVLTSATAPGSKRAPYRHTLAASSTERMDYASSTLPTTKREKKRHQVNTPRPLGARAPLNPVQPPPHLRRASIALPYTSPTNQPIPAIQTVQDTVQLPVQRRRLPMTPNEEPFQHTQEVVRPHSRAESAPDPLPLPFRPKLAHRIQSPPVTSPNASPPPAPHSPPKSRSPLMTPDPVVYKEPLVSPLSHISNKVHKRSSKPGPALNPITRPRSMSVGGNASRRLSGSVDAQLHLHTKQPHTMSALFHQRSQVAPRSRQTRDVPQLGWTSASQFSSHKKLDIQSLMQNSAYTSYQDIPHGVVNKFGMESDSTHSIELKHDIFSMHDRPHHHGPSPHASKTMVTSAESLKVDPISGAHSIELKHSMHNQPHHHGPSPHASKTMVTSAESLKVDPISGAHSVELKHGMHNQPHHHGPSPHAPKAMVTSAESLKVDPISGAEHHKHPPRSLSAKRTQVHSVHPPMGTYDGEPHSQHVRNGPVHQKHLESEKERDLLDFNTGSLRERPTSSGNPRQRRKSGKGGGGFNLSRAFNFKSSREKSLSGTLHPSPTLTGTE